MTHFVLDMKQKIVDLRFVVTELKKENTALVSRCNILEKQVRLLERDKRDLYVASGELAADYQGGIDYDCE